MKKIIVCMLAITIMLSVFCIGGVASAPFSITDAAIMQGTDDAPISSRIVYEFNYEISSVGDVSLCKPGSDINLVSEVDFSGNKLVIKLSKELDYSTAYILDLSSVTSVGGSALSDGVINFETKTGFYCEDGTTTGWQSPGGVGILEDDFELLDTLNGKKWRTDKNVEIGVKATAENPYNKAAKLCKTLPADCQLSNYAGGSTGRWLYFDNRAIFDFDIFFEDMTANSKWNFLTIQGLVDEDRTSRTKAWQNASNILTYANGNLEVNDNDSTSMPLIANDWNSIRIVLSIDSFTYKVYLNGVLMTDGTTSEFTIPGTRWVEGAAISNAVFEEKNGNTVWIDNVSYKRASADTSSVLSYSIPAGYEAVNVVQPIDIKFSDEIVSLDLCLNGTTVDNSEITEISSTKFNFTNSAPLSWGESYSLTGTATDIYGDTCSVSLDYSVRTQPDEWIEVLGFYYGDTKADCLQPGNINAKLRIWGEDKNYIYVLASYKETDGYIEMQSFKCNNISYISGSAFNLADISVSDDTAYVKLYIFDNLANRNLVSSSIIYGTDTIR